MLSRRELITAGVAGGVAATPVAAAAPVEQQADREGHREIAGEIRGISTTLRTSLLTNSVAHGTVSKIRDQMQIFLRANQKFPDFIEIGVSVFMDLYDWHVKNRQQLLVTRGADGRYWMQFMFTTMILRPETDLNFIGIPFDKG